MLSLAYKALSAPAPLRFILSLSICTHTLTLASTHARPSCCNALSPLVTWPTTTYDSAQALPSKHRIRGPSPGL